MDPKMKPIYIILLAPFGDFLGTKFGIFLLCPRSRDKRGFFWDKLCRGEGDLEIATWSQDFA